MRTTRGTIEAHNRRQDRRYMRQAPMKIAAYEAAGQIERAEAIRVKVARVAMAQMIGQTWHGNRALRESVISDNETRANSVTDER